MARIRNIKPSFFDDDDVCALKPLTRLLFIGLWCWADKAGRLEDRPQRIKANILPEDNGSADAMLASLSAAGFIQRYQADGRKYIQITGFEKHQRPHVKEVESTIPAPVPNNVPSTDPSTALNGARSALEKREERREIRDGDLEKREERSTPLTPQRGETPAQRAKGGSKRKRDVTALRETQTPEERYAGKYAAKLGIEAV